MVAAQCSLAHLSVAGIILQASRCGRCYGVTGGDCMPLPRRVLRLSCNATAVTKPGRACGLGGARPVWYTNYAWRGGASSLGIVRGTDQHPRRAAPPAGRVVQRCPHGLTLNVLPQPMCARNGRCPCRVKPCVCQCGEVVGAARLSQLLSTDVDLRKVGQHRVGQPSLVVRREGATVNEALHCCKGVVACCSWWTLRPPAVVTFLHLCRRSTPSSSLGRESGGERPCLGGHQRTQTGGPLLSARTTRRSNASILWGQVYR